MPCQPVSRFACRTVWSTARLALAALGLATAHAGTGLLTLAVEGQPPLTLAYPTRTPDTPIPRGPYTLPAAPDAPPAGGNGRLVVLSHGSGGSFVTEFDLARALVHAGFTVAMPEHAGDNWQDMRDVGPVSWARRPQELSQAIDTVATLAAPGRRLAPLRLDVARVGVYGMSAGGIAALTLAGARWSPALQARHCDAHLAQDFAACVGLTTELTGGVLDGAKLAIARSVILHRWADDTRWRTAHDPRVAAVVAAVPMASPIDMASLAPPRVPLGLVRAGRDAWLAPRFHIDAVRAACEPHCTLLADLAEGGHGAPLSPPPVGLPPRAARLLDDPPGFDRLRALPTVYDAIVNFYQTRLVCCPAN